MSADWLELSTNSSIVKYRCFLNFEQEPYFIVKYTNHTMVYDEKYINYGFNKIQYFEYWRLQGFDDTDFDKAKEVSPETNLYKQSGNSISVNVLEDIFRNLYLGEN